MITRESKIVHIRKAQSGTIRCRKIFAAEELFDAEELFCAEISCIVVFATRFCKKGTGNTVYILTLVVCGE